MCGIKVDDDFDCGGTSFCEKQTTNQNGSKLKEKCNVYDHERSDKGHGYTQKIENNFSGNQRKFCDSPTAHKFDVEFQSKLERLLEENSPKRQRSPKFSCQTPNILQTLQQDSHNNAIKYSPNIEHQSEIVLSMLKDSTKSYQDTSNFDRDLINLQQNYSVDNKKSSHLQKILPNVYQNSPNFPPNRGESHENEINRLSNQHDTSKVIQESFNEQKFRESPQIYPNFQQNVVNTDTNVCPSIKLNMMKSPNFPAFNIQGYIKDLLTEKFTDASSDHDLMKNSYSPKSINSDSSFNSSNVQENYIKEEPMDDDNYESHQSYESENFVIKTEDDEKFEVFNSESKAQEFEKEDEIKQEFPLLLSALSSKTSPIHNLQNQNFSCLKHSQSSCNCSTEVNYQSKKERIIKKYLEDPTVTITSLSRWSEIPRTTVGRIIENFKIIKAPTLKRPGTGRKIGSGNTEREANVVKMLKINPQLTVRQLSQMFGTCPANIQKIKVRNALIAQRGNREDEFEDD